MPTSPNTMIATNGRLSIRPCQIHFGLAASCSMVDVMIGLSRRGDGGCLLAADVRKNTAAETPFVRRICAARPPADQASGPGARFSDQSSLLSLKAPASGQPTGASADPPSMLRDLV